MSVALAVALLALLVALFTLVALVAVYARVRGLETAGDAAGMGARGWELDALDPRSLRERVQAAIDAEIARPAWERSGRAEAAEKESLGAVARTWRQIKFGLASE